MLRLIRRTASTSSLSSSSPGLRAAAGIVGVARERLPTTAAARLQQQPSSSSSSGSSRSINTVTSAGSSSDPTHDRLLVIGSGVAGCSAALIAAERHSVPVTLLFAGSLPTDCNSFWAQGGIIYRNPDPSSGDSPQSLRDDVVRAGAGVCEDDAVWKVAMEGPDRVRELLLNDDDHDGDDNPRGRGGGGPFANVPFDRDDDGSLSLCLEASHAAPRIIHRADSTGRAITEHITAAALKHPLITPVADAVVTDLAIAPSVNPGLGADVCVGAHVLNRRTGRRATLATTRGVVLASGGLGGIYEHSTNPAGFNALGSSAALALRAAAGSGAAGAERTTMLKDMEYVQFHPTSLYIPGEARFLLTEALRGEGAVLRDASGRAFASDYHPDGELAPRDVVARAVFAESQKKVGGDSGEHNAYLDITHRDPQWLRTRFPSIDAHLLQRDMDITSQPLPVVPAAHYTCGGVSTDLKGRTAITGLYAAGEAARTGLHGANRLASTSLLEGLVYGAAVADFVGGEGEGREAIEMAREALNNDSNVGGSSIVDPLEERRSELNITPAINGEALRYVSAATTLLARLKRIMWDDVGLIRTPTGLSRAIEGIDAISEEAEDLFVRAPTAETAGLRDAASAGGAVARAALGNRVSRGGHTIVLDEGELEKKEKRQRKRQKEEEEEDVDVVVAAASAAGAA